MKITIGGRGIAFAIAAAVFALGGTIAYATGAVTGTSGTGTAVINACQNKTSGLLKVVTSTTQCNPSSEIPLSWNVQGVKGDQGIAGIDGKNGVDGAAGKDGLNGVSVTSAMLALNDPNCMMGGSSFTSITGVTYACNGAPGAAGAAGAAGAPGLPGADGAAGNDGTSCVYPDGTLVSEACRGPEGPRGPQGIQGPQGPAGSALVGSACTIPGGGTGTIQMNVATSGAITFTCAGAGAGGGGGGGGGGGTPCPSPLPSYPNANTVCNSSTGAIAIICVGGWANVNGSLADGCEVNLVSDPANCGTPGRAIPAQGTNHANYACLGGAPAITSCQTGFLDRDAQVGNGCEVDMSSDPSNCGSPGRAIPAQGANHANYACVGGAPAIISCQPPFFDADGLVGNGCEYYAGSFEPNDSFGTAFQLGPLPPGGNTTFNAEQTPADEDWYRFAVTSCSVVTPCRPLVTPAGVPSDHVVITRDDGAVLNPGVPDEVFGPYSYTIHVLPNGGFRLYSMHITN